MLARFACDGIELRAPSGVRAILRSYTWRVARHLDYVGPSELRDRRNLGRTVRSRQELTAAVDAFGPGPLTFVIDPSDNLRLAPRESEHVNLADGGPVLAGGEITFDLDRNAQVEAVSNQSTGFCPPTSTWTAVASALDVLGVEHPGTFTSAHEFRRCDRCGARCLVKDEWYHCDECDAPLPAEWNFG